MSVEFRNKKSGAISKLGLNKGKPVILVRNPSPAIVSRGQLLSAKEVEDMKIKGLLKKK
jgi:hypothetical protein